MPPAPLFRPATLNEIYDLRCAILRPHHIEMDLHFPGDDLPPPATFHFGTFLDHRNIACLTLMTSTWNHQPAYQLRGMAVAADLQSRGIGAQLLHAASQHLAALPSLPQLWWCNARLRAIPFYQRNGWQLESEQFDIPQIGPHKKMSRPPGTPIS